MDLAYKLHPNPLMQRRAHEVLRIARCLITDVTLWSQWARARDLYGNPVRPHDPTAYCWSLNGALSVASNPYGITPPALLEFLDSILREYGLVELLYCEEGITLWETCDYFNDMHPHPEVLALLDEAARRTATI
jgi:hypothetical protein